MAVPAAVPSVAVRHTASRHPKDASRHRGMPRGMPRACTVWAAVQDRRSAALGPETALSGIRTQVRYPYSQTLYHKATVTKSSNNESLGVLSSLLL